MKRISQRGMYNPVADINIVPMMDLVWNLLIVFMLATPFLEQSINLKLPTADTGVPVDTKDVTTVDLDSAGRIFIEKNLMTLTELEQFAKNKLAGNKEHAMIVRGDERVPYGKFVEIVDHLKKAGVTKLGIMGLSSKQ